MRFRFVELRISELKGDTNMLRNKTMAAVLMGGVLASLPAFSQEENPVYKNEASVQAFGSFVKSTVTNGVEQRATNSGGVLAGYRFFFDKHNGVELNYGYALNTQSYGLAGGLAGVNSFSHEASAAYVLRFPLKRWSPFALAGVGGLVFDPNDVPGASTQARAAFVYGAGADFNLSKHIFMRAEYRGLVYNSPTFDTPALNGLDRVTHRAEPSVGFGYRF
jgi:opacity protein-like surface antigen